MGEVRYDQEDDQWQDTEDDGEKVEIVSLFDNEKFTNVKSMLQYCQEKYSFDFIDIQKCLGTQFENKGVHTANCMKVWISMAASSL